MTNIKILHRSGVVAQDLFRGANDTWHLQGPAKTLRRRVPHPHLTHRLFIHFFHAAAVQQTIYWLDNHGNPYWDLCFMKEKDQVGADIYIGDKSYAGHGPQGSPRWQGSLLRELHQ